MRVKVTHGFPVQSSAFLVQIFANFRLRNRIQWPHRQGEKNGREDLPASQLRGQILSEDYAATCRSRRCALRPKNSAWLATAETTASWNGLAIRNAGSGRWPVRKRSGYAVMKMTGTSNEAKSSFTASRPELPSASWMSARIRPGRFCFASDTASLW